MIFFIDANGGERGSAAHGMAVVGQPAVENFVLEMLRDVMAHADRAQRQVAGSESLGHADQVGNDFPVIDGEPFARAAEAGHDFVGDHQDAVLVAELANALQVAIGRNQNAVGADHGLENEGGDGVRAFELNDFFDHGERSFG